ncbi:MAG TPA: leucyl aminopeptidase [Tissierellaceae bacterium]|nr:leucyl aminopeptidase [Tissierellaceae bacterium]
MEFKLEQGGKTKILLVTESMDELNIQNELYQYLKESEIFKGSLKETYLDLNLNKENFLFLGLGKEKDLTINDVRKAFHKAGKDLMNIKAKSVGISITELGDLDYNEIIAAATEGLLHSEYAFEKHLTEKKVKPTLEEVYFDIPSEEKDKALEAIEETKSLINGIFLARDLVNERAINMYPKILANTAKDNLEDLNVKVDIYDKKAIKDMSMEALLAVSQGSDKEPKFIVMTYNGNPDSEEKIALVGKGLTYDSGGYSLKPSLSMDTMFSDMGGAGTVIGAMKSIAKSKLKKNVVGIIPACENLISGSAYKPGDIIGSMSGKTIEVLNTDAEGRLALADALWYAATEVKADKIINLATLTGACLVALGNTTTGAITNNDKFMDEVYQASKISGEPVWQLPSHPDYKKQIKGDFADLNNTGGKGAGTITAGLFLEEFVDDTPWVHLDIAGTAYIDKPNGYLPKGATGVHVKTLYYLVKNQ